jgi:hypothetical protein
VYRDDCSIVPRKQMTLLGNGLLSFIPSGKSCNRVCYTPYIACCSTARAAHASRLIHLSLHVVPLRGSLLAEAHGQAKGIHFSALYAVFMGGRGYSELYCKLWSYSLLRIGHAESGGIKSFDRASFPSFLPFPGREGLCSCMCSPTSLIS